MIYANYHTHTKRCNHAAGEDREYVEAAIEAGIRELGFSDHSPMIFPNSDYYSGFRMTPDKTEDYVRSVTDLRDEYKNDITIRLGFEMEYYPQCFEPTLDFLRPYSYDYLLLGQHFVGEEETSPYSSAPLTDENLLRKYVDLVIEGMETGEFLYIAHPDVINFVGDREIYAREMRRICEYAKENDIVLEYNEHGHEGHRHYPNNEFLRLCGETGNTLIIGVDAHDPEELLSDELRHVSDYLCDIYGISTVDCIDPIKFRKH